MAEEYGREVEPERGEWEPKRVYREMSVDMDVLFAYELKKISEGASYRKTCDFGKDSTYHDVFRWMARKSNVDSFVADPSNAVFLERGRNLVELAKGNDVLVYAPPFIKNVVKEVRTGTANRDNLNLVVYFPYYMVCGNYEKDRRRTSEKLISKFQGSVGQRIERHLKVDNVIFSESIYGVTKTHYMSDADGNRYCWMSSGKKLDRNAEYDLTMKVKSHFVVNEEQITYVKNVEIVKPSKEAR